MEGLVAEEASRPFDLELGPLVRGRLIRESEDLHTLLITMHHIVFDGWSMGIFVNELSALYRAYAKGEADALPVLEVQYADYAIWQRQWISGELFQVRQITGKQLCQAYPSSWICPRIIRARPSKTTRVG